MPANPLNNIVIVLIGTKYAGNLGSVARAMHNMGLKHLRLVSPQCTLDDEAYRMARAGEILLSKARSYASFKKALRGISFTVGTTGKTGGNRSETSSPRALTPTILARAKQQKVAIIFGPEDTGLVDDDLELCQMLVRIPTHPQARSMNLSQAVMVMSYELFLGRLGRERGRALELASVEQVEAMYAHLKKALTEIGFLRPQNARHMMFALRRLFGRSGLAQSDVALLRGIARQITWYAGK
jgi:tRNA/rRNA methyltransferase